MPHYREKDLSPLGIMLRWSQWLPHSGLLSDPCTTCLVGSLFADIKIWKLRMHN